MIILLFTFLPRTVFAPSLSPQKQTDPTDRHLSQASAEGTLRVAHTQSQGEVSAPCDYSVLINLDDIFHKKKLRAEVK